MARHDERSPVIKDFPLMTNSLYAEYSDDCERVQAESSADTLQERLGSPQKGFVQEPQVKPLHKLL
jgi:hypothetical protein